MEIAVSMKLEHLMPMRTALSIMVILASVREYRMFMIFIPLYNFFWDSFGTVDNVSVWI